MKKTRQALFRSISIILSVMLIVSALPITVFAEGNTGDTGTKGVNTGVRGIGSTTFVAPASSLTASAWQMKVSGAGSVNMEQVTNAQWNSTDNSGVQFYYSLMDSSGSVFTNNAYSGGTGLPSEYGTVSYCFVYYAEDPSTAGRELSNVVPVGMDQSEWLSKLENYEKDPTHLSDGCVDYRELLQTELTWVDSSDTTLPLAYSLGSEGSIVYEPHWYSVFVKLEQDGSDPFISTDNSVVYVHDGSGGTGGGTGEGGGSGEGGGTVPSGFAGPAVSVRANPYALANGTMTQVSDAEYESVSNSGVRFCYFVIDSNYAAFGNGTGQKALNVEDGNIEFAYVYSDTVPSDNSITSLCPVGMTAQAWQTAVSDYRSQWMSDNPRAQVDYTDLLATLNWTTNDSLTVYTDNQVYGTSGGGAHYSNRFYGAFVRWSKNSDVLYGTDCPLVYLHEKAPDVITSPISSAIAIPCNTSTNASVSGTQVIIPRTATETGVEFRYSITDYYNVTWSNADVYNPKPVDTSAVRVEYLWTYTDYANMALIPAGRVPIGMSSLDWNNMRNDYLTEWLSEHSEQEPDYSDLIIDLPGWTTDPVLPLFDDETVYGAGNGEAGVYTPRYYSCMVRLTFLDGSGYRKAFINTGYSVQIRFGSVDGVNAPVTFDGMELRYYDTSKHIYDYVWQSVGYVSVESYTDFIVGYVLTDDLGHQYGNLDYGHPALPSNAHFEYLWNYISLEDYNGNSGTTAISNIFPGWNATPCGMTKAAWQALTDGKSDEEKDAVLATLTGWTEDNRMPVYSKGEREGTTANRGTYDRCYYSCYARLIVDGEVAGYYHNCNAALIGVSLQTRTNIDDRAYTLNYNAPDSVTLTFNVYRGGSPVNANYQWYCSDTRDAGIRTPLIGETGNTLTINFEKGVPHDKYYFCGFYYSRGNGHYVDGQSNVARVCVTNAPTGFVNANTGKNYYFEDHHPYGAAINDLHSSAYGGGSSQTAESQTTLSARWYVYGNCSRMTWQWFETDKNGSHISAVSSLHTVNDPFEYGSELIDGNRKADISIPCPADEVGTKYYRVVVTNYEPGGESFTCESNVITVDTLPAENRENLFEIDENGRLTRYLGFEDEVVIPSTIRGTKVTAIGNSFANGVNYPRVVIPEGVVTIEDSAFRDCFGLREVVLPNSLQSIGVQSFMRCGITSLTIPQGVQTIHKEAFKWAFTDLSEVTVNAESLTVNKGAFQEAYMKKIVFNCTTALTLDADVDTNPFNYKGCFDSCPNLYFFGFPENIPVVTHANTIYDCPKLAWVDNYNSIEGNDKARGICYGQACCLIKSKAVRFGDWICIKDYNLKDDGNYASVSCGWSVAKKLWSSETVVTLPETLGGENVTGWGCGTFYSYGSRIIYSDMQTEVVPGCHVNLTDSPETLTEVILPETIRHISDYCAKGYSALTTVNFSDCPNLSRIGMFAFEYCPLTGAFNLPGEYQRCSIGQSAFKNTDLTSADLDRAILYPNAFNYCYQLTEVTGNWRVETTNTVRELYNLIAPRCGSPYPVVFSFFFLSPAFPDSYNYTYYGKTKITDKNADYVSSATGYPIYRMYRTGKYWYSGTPDNAAIRYYVGYDDTSVTMPAMIYNMDQKQAYHIKTVTVCDHLPVNNCMKVDYALTIQEGIEVLDGDFDRAYSVTLPEGLTSFTYKSFNDNKLLTEITIPSSVTAISNGAFEYADNLANVTFAPGSQCKIIGNCAFREPALTDINLPEGLETISQGAFADCVNLKEITLPNTLRSIGKYAFVSSGLESIDFPASLLEIGDSAFKDCKSLTNVVIPDTVKLIGEGLFDGCDALLSVTLPDSLTKIPEDMFSWCESLTTVNIPSSCTLIEKNAFEGCSSLNTIYIPFGVNRIEEFAFASSGIWSLYIPASVDFIGYNVVSKRDKKADDPTINVLSHASVLPIFERDTFISPPDPHISHIFCYEGSNAQGCAIRYVVSYSFLTADDYRLIEISDGEGNPVTSEQILQTKWYDNDTDTLIFEGKSFELPASMSNLTHNYRCEVTYSDSFINNNIVQRTETYVFAPNEMKKTVKLDSRPDVTISFILPQFYGTSFLLTVEQPDGNKYYSTTNTVIDEKPAFTLTTKWFPATLTVSAENFDTLTLTNVQGEFNGETHIDSDLGEITLTPNGPLLHYKLSYHAPNDDTLFNISDEIDGTYKLYNNTQDKDVTAYMTFEAGTFITITNDAADVGDTLCFSFVPESRTQEYGVEQFTFTVPWANGSGELSTMRQTRGKISITDNGADYFLFDYTEKDILKVRNYQDTYYVLPGTYRLLAFRGNVNVGAGTIKRATSVEEIMSMGLSSDQIYDETVAIVPIKTVSVEIPELPRVKLPDFQISGTSDRKGAVGEYIPVTVNYSFDSSLADVQKKIVISFSPYTYNASPLLQSDGKYAWQVGGTLLGDVEFTKPRDYSFIDSTLTINVDSLSGSFVIYGLQETRFFLHQSAGVYSFRTSSVNTPRLDGDLSEWWISKLPSMKSLSSNGKVPLDIYHPKLGQYHYFRVYKNGELIEKSLGCGYTEEIAPYNVSCTIKIMLPAEKLEDKLNVVRYDFTVSTCRNDPAVFSFGQILFGEGADESNTRVFDSQTVTYYPAASDVPTPVGLKMNVTNNNGSNSNKYVEGFVSLDGSEQDKKITYMFYNYTYWKYSDKSTGYMNDDGILTKDMIYDFSLTVFKPEMVTDQKVTLTVYCGETSEDPVFDVTLHRNPVTGTFDGQLVLEGGNYTADQLPAYFDVDFLYNVPDSGSLESDTGSIEGKAIVDAENWFTDAQERMADDAEAFAPVDKDEFLKMMATVAPAGEEGEEILETAALVCDYQNTMAGYYSSMMDQLRSQVENEAFSQDVINNGYIAPSLFGDTDSAVAVYKDIEFDADTLLDSGFTAHGGKNGSVYYVKHNEKGSAFYDPVSKMLHVSSYDKSDVMSVNLPGVGQTNTMGLGSGTNSAYYEFDEVLIGYGGAATWLNSLLEAEKEYYDNQFGISIRKLDEYVNNIYQKICTVKMFIDLSKENINAFQMKLDEANLKNFKNCFNILPEEYKNSTAFAAKTNTGLTGKNSKAYAAALEEASDFLDGMMKKIYDFRERIKTYYTGAVKERKSLSTLDKIMKELKSDTPKAKFAQFAKGASAGFGALMVIFDIISGLSTIVDAYDMYLGKINGNLYNQFGWMVNTLAAMPTGPYPGVYSDQYKACVHACFEYADQLHTVRGYYTAAYYKEVVSFVITLTADIIGAVRPDIGLAVGVTNWTLGNVSEIFTKGFAGLSEVAAGKLEDKVSDTCIGKKEEDDNNNNNKNSSKGKNNKKQVNKKKIDTGHYTDPAGYVYEAVASNRVPGATVTCYNKGTNGELLLWDAAESGQENPLITDANGEYQWFVPIGDWRVVAEKDGYITSDSANDPAAVDGWLPVPPPQMEVYIPIVSTALPTVQSVQAGADHIRIEFSQYMDIDELTYYPELVTVTDHGAAVEVDRTFTDREVSPTNSLKYYGRVLTLSRHDGAKFSGDQLKVFVDKNFFNYAGNGMETSYESENLSVGQIAGTLSHSYPNRFAGSIGEEADIVIQVLDTSLYPMAGATVNVEGGGSNTLLMPDFVVTDENGRAVFHAKVASSGYDTLTFTCGDASVDLETYVNPIGTVKPEKPTANLSDFETVACGTQLVISSATEGAVIRYTLDNSCPCDENALVYDGPITITDDVFVRIAAWTETGGYSERLNLHLKCEKENDLSFYGATLTLQNDLKVNFYVERSKLTNNGYTEPYAVFDMNGNTVTVSNYTEATVSDVEYYVFSFSNIAPDIMNDTIRAVLHATKGGAPAVGKELTYSISQYCYSTLGKTSDAKLRTLLVDLLNYGAAAQTYTGYKTDSLVNAGLTEEQRAWGTSAEPELHSHKNTKYSTLEAPSVNWAGVSLNLRDSITMQFVFTTDSTNGVTVKVENDKGAVLKEIASDEFVTSGGYYIAAYKGLTAGQMSDTVYITAYKGDTKVSDTVAYSIESYAFAKQNDAKESLASLVRAMMKYGNSAYSYAH